MNMKIKRSSTCKHMESLPLYIRSEEFIKNLNLPYKWLNVAKLTEFAFILYNYIDIFL